jgi:hypothetical protein
MISIAAKETAVNKPAQQEQAHWVPAASNQRPSSCYRKRLHTQGGLVRNPPQTCGILHPALLHHTCFLSQALEQCNPNRPLSESVLRTHYACMCLAVLPTTPRQQLPILPSSIRICLLEGVTKTNGNESKQDPRSTEQANHVYMLSVSWEVTRSGHTQKGDHYFCMQ